VKLAVLIPGNPGNTSYITTDTTFNKEYQFEWLLEQVTVSAIHTRRAN